MTNADKATAPSASALSGVLSKLENLGDRGQSAADRIKALAERVDAAIQQCGPRIGLRFQFPVGLVAKAPAAEFELTDCSWHEDAYLLVAKWDKSIAENGDGMWHVLYERTRTSVEVGIKFPEESVYCQPLPGTKLEYREHVVPLITAFLKAYEEAAEKHVARIEEAERAVATFEGWAVKP